MKQNHLVQKVVYIVSDIDKSLGFEWTALHLKSKYVLSFVLIGKHGTALEKYLSSIGVPCYVIADKDYPGNLNKWWKLLLYLKREKPQIVHSQLWRATLLAMTTSWLLRIKKRIFTRHHAALHYNEFPSGRKWDRLCNFLSTDIVAISQNVETILVDWDKANPGKVHVIHHGFDLDYFSRVDESEVVHLRNKYRLNHYPVVGVISRYLKLKGIQYVIPAVRKIREQFPDAHLVLANASGHYAQEIKSLLATLPHGSYTEIAFEKDLASLYQVFDVFVHTPVDATVEAFGQTYVEALAAGVPSVFTFSGVAPEFVRHEENALIVAYKNPEATATAIQRVLTDKALAESLIHKGRRSALRFSLPNMLTKLEALYEAP